jgi:nucleotide-binding universal stress UspA family protein
MGQVLPDAQLRRTLVCVSASKPHARRILQVATVVSRAVSSELIVLHIGRDDAAVRTAMTDLLAEFDIPPENLRICLGNPADLVCREAREAGVHLIVAGALDRERALRDIIGSTARRIVRRAPCSVLLHVHRGHPKFDWRHTVLAAPFDAMTDEFLNDILHIARLDARPILHLIWEGVAVPTAATRMSGELDKVDKGRQLWLATEKYKMANRLERLDLEGVVLMMDAVEASGGRGAVHFADHIAADLLVISARKERLGLWDRFFGHPVEVALQKLPCSLLVHRCRETVARESIGNSTP